MRVPRQSTCPAQLDGIHSFDAENVCRHCSDLDPLVAQVEDNETEHTRDILTVLRERIAASHSNRYEVAAADEIARMRAEVAQLQRGAFVLNVHDRIYEAGMDELIAWDSIDWRSLSAGREATFIPKPARHIEWPVSS